MDFDIWCWLNFSWDDDSTAALTTNDHQNLMRHVKTRYKGHGNRSTCFQYVVDCADGTVNACIQVEVEHDNNFDDDTDFDDTDFSRILVEIVEADNKNTKKKA
jgi:hypothetical protein